MKKELTLSQKLDHIQTEGGSISFNFENGSKQVQNISKNVFVNEKGRNRNPTEILDIFKGICHDLGAVSFDI